MSQSESSTTAYEKLKARLSAVPCTWLITGVAGFIGSNLLETLLKLDQRVIGLDNFATGHQRNLDDVRLLVEPPQWDRFKFVEGDIRTLEHCRTVCHGVEYVLHQAALGSVPRSIEDPIASNATNVDGFLNMLVAARDAGVKKFVYAASSSTYGDHPALPKVEDCIGKPLSPYAVTKYVNELYASVFANTYGLRTTGLRYFNVFGPRQDPNGAYAAVIPKWIAAMMSGDAIYINGDGETSRDFCYIENAVQANLLAAYGKEDGSLIFNVAVGERLSLRNLFEELKRSLRSHEITYAQEPIFRDFRKGDVMHSQASIDSIRNTLEYSPEYTAVAGIEQAVSWYVRRSTDFRIKNA